MPSVCVVELYVTVSYIKISSVAQQCFYGKFVASNNKTYVGLHVTRHWTQGLRVRSRPRAMDF
jgi:hypothetical protein